jgi:hypothetical protein
MGCIRLFDSYGGVHSHGGYPNSWMVYNGKAWKGMDDLGILLIFGIKLTKLLSNLALWTICIVIMDYSCSQTYS